MMEDQQQRRHLQSLSGLCDYVLDQCERDRIRTAGELHDEIGGLLVAARLNVAWIQERVASEDPEVGVHFQRLHDALRRGVEVKRRIVEDLHPTLLDNIGLYAALRWQMAKACDAANLPYTADYPEDELTLQPHAAITLYRIIEEAIRNVVAHAHARHAQLAVEETADHLRLTIRDDGIGITADQRGSASSFGIAAMAHRVARLGGALSWPAMQTGGTAVQIAVPLANLQQPARTSS